MREATVPGIVRQIWSRVVGSPCSRRRSSITSVRLRSSASASRRQRLASAAIVRIANDPVLLARDVSTSRTCGRSRRCGSRESMIPIPPSSAAIAHRCRSASPCHVGGFDRALQRQTGEPKRRQIDRGWITPPGGRLRREQEVVEGRAATRSRSDDMTSYRSQLPTPAQGAFVSKITASALRSRISMPLHAA